VTVGFFSFSAGKQDLYIFPIVPAVAALGGAAIARGLEDSVWRRWLVWTLAASGAALALAAVGVLLLFDTAGRVYAIDGAIAIGVLAAAGGALACGFAVRGRPEVSAFALFASLVLVNWTFVTRTLPAFERYKPAPAFSRDLTGRLDADDLVVEYHVAMPSLVFYLGRHVDEYPDDEMPFVRAITSTHRVYAVLPANDYAALRSRIARRTCVIDRAPIFDARLNHMLARQPLPELLLITNTCR
jgi:4-amino-4-deoxy-L-arabinose transferase-like glycosyltransferase